ncbi:MAG: polysaccharide deacetylase family protein [Verrucomicrobiota bacterium]
MYHMVRDHIAGARYNKMRVEPAEFAWQMDWLKSTGWHFLSTYDLVSRWDKWPEKSVVVTFDDGYSDNYYNAFPVLKRLEIPFTIYLVTNRHDNDWSINKKKEHSSGELKEEPKLSDSEVQEMLDSGLLELGGHTLNHVNLLNEAEAVKKSEIADCAKALRDTYGAEIFTFCYPFGLYDASSVQIVKDVSYSGAFTVEEKLCDAETSPFEVGRLKVSGKMSRLAFRRMLLTGRRKLFG